MINVLCFGDSNTWGTKPEGGRYAQHERWSGLLSDYLNDNNSSSNDSFDVVEAGQPNRTLAQNSPFEGDKTGLIYLKPLLEKHQPDVVILLLGTNDLKAKFALSAFDIATAAAALIEQIQTFAQDKMTGPNLISVLLVSPPVIKEVGVYKKIYKSAGAKSESLALEYTKQADHLGCYFFNANEVVSSSELDGIHWDLKEHKKFAQALATCLNETHFKFQL